MQNGGNCGKYKSVFRQPHSQLCARTIKCLCNLSFTLFDYLRFVVLLLWERETDGFGVSIKPKS